MKVLSLGAGVQSSTLYLMAVHGEIERPDVAIFADTRWEPRDVYAWLDELERIGGDRVPIERVAFGDIRANALNPARRFATMPLFTHAKDGGVGMLRRQCTVEYKIKPIVKEVRRRLGVPKGRPVPDGMTAEMWLGISTDEAQRMRDNHLAWITNRYPLIDANMSRSACVRWLERNGYARPPKSACIGCPFHDDRTWRRMKDEAPDEWADAIAFDEAVRNLSHFDGQAYLHRSARPLADVDLSTPEDRGQTNLFLNECEGHCGV
jgi:hypothetical protein